MTRLLPILPFFTFLSSCVHTTQYSAEVGPWPVRALGDGLFGPGPRYQVPFSVPAPGLYDVVLWYFITDSGAGYEALALVTGTAEVTYRGRVIERGTLPRRGARSDRFTDTNGLILVRFEAPSRGRYLVRMNITSVPPDLEITGAGVRVLKLADRKRPNPAMQRTAPRSVSSVRVATTFGLQPRALSGAVADLVSR
jgi:hypothetical protein